MIQSMTGYGRAKQGSMIIEIRSVNHRYLDISVRFPRALSFLEEPLREFLTGRLARGKVELGFSADNLSAEVNALTLNRDALESKLFGIGSEAYVTGSHEFYMGYAVKNGKILCLDAGHFHPTEGIADKISAVLQFVPELLLHVSRGMRWDSDHVVLLDDQTRAIMEELVRGEFLERTHIGLDFFDATINRVAAWTIGTRAMLKALLTALLEPISTLRQLELDGDFTRRLAMLEELKTLPFGPIWDRWCEMNDVPVGMAWMDEVRKYEKDVLSQRK